MDKEQGKIAGPSRRFRVRSASLRLHPLRLINRKSGDSSKTLFYFLEIKSTPVKPRSLATGWWAVIVHTYSFVGLPVFVPSE